MIYLYSGTPGSGKSLDCARMIYYTLKRKRPVICNFEINTQYVDNADLFTYVRNDELTPEFLMDYANEYFKGRKVKEGAITLVIDECQMMFNSRDWSKADRQGWNTFFQIHRHYGYDIVLIAQFDRMIDRQIRSLIEYEIVHRKVSNFGWKGKFLCVLMLSPVLFVRKKVWYPMKERCDAQYFRAHKKFYRLYDTFKLSYDDNCCTSEVAVEPQNEE
jgi:zona occludens toxin (predicted ATPase)